MKLAALIAFVVATTTCGAADVATQLTVSRLDYDLPALEKPAERDSLTFRIFIRPAFSEGGYAVEGTLQIPEIGEACGSMTIVERASPEPKRQTFALTHLQAREVYGWFSEAKFLDPRTDETAQAPVLDGDEILIEGFVGRRYFHFHRNSVDSIASATFFRRVQEFHIWKEQPDHASAPASPNRGSSK